MRFYLGGPLLLSALVVDGLSLQPGCARAAAAPARCQAWLVGGGGYILKELPPAKAGILILTWSKVAASMRADGFKPNSEAIGDRAVQLKQIAAALPELGSKANVLALCSQGSMSFDTLQEPHASMAKRLSLTTVTGALSAGIGSAVGFVSRWPDHVSIDGCAFNPSFLLAGEDAERKLIEHVVAEALRDGCEDIRLSPGGLQLDEAHFYESCGFRAVDGSEQLSYVSEPAVVVAS